jgi:hypothetical protein
LPGRRSHDVLRGIEDRFGLPACEAIAADIDGC